MVSEAPESRGLLEPIGRVCFEAGRISGNHGTKLFTFVSVVAVGVCRIRPQLVKVGGRKIDSQLDAVLSGCIGDLAEHATLPSPPRAGRNRVVWVTGGPQVKPVVMLANQDHHLAAGILDASNPLVRIQLRRVQY